MSRFLGIFSLLVGSASAATITVQPRQNGPSFGDDIGNVGYSSGGDFDQKFTESHGNDPWRVTLGVFNQDLDGDGVAESFTFELVANTTNAGSTGVSVWNQGLSNSNSAGLNPYPADNYLQGLYLAVENVAGTTSLGQTVVFDGFSAATVGSGTGIGGTLDRSVQAGGESFAINETNSSGGYLYRQQQRTFDSPQETLIFSNEGGSSGSFNIRSLSLDFSASTVSAVPEPSGVLALGCLFGASMLTRRRS